MARSRERYSKKEVRERKEKKRKEKEKKRLERKEGEKKSSLDDMIAYVDEHGRITSEKPDDLRKKSDVKIEDIEISVPKKDSTAEMETERTGTVSFFNESKGFGFIKDPDLRDDVFFHVNNVLQEVKEGNKVSYELEKGKKGMTAVNVKPVK
jgi:cold shock CspA family protein